MYFYTIHIARDADGKAYDIRAVGDRFHWPAALLTTLWALRHRLWLEAVALAVLPSVLTRLLFASSLWTISDVAAFLLLSLAYTLTVGLWAPSWQRFALARRGFATVDTVLAPSARAARRVFLDTFDRKTRRRPRPGDDTTRNTHRRPRAKSGASGGASPPAAEAI